MPLQRHCLSHAAAKKTMITQSYQTLLKANVSVIWTASRTRYSDSVLSTSVTRGTGIMSNCIGHMKFTILLGCWLYWLGVPDEAPSTLDQEVATSIAVPRSTLNTTMAAYALFNQRVDWDDRVIAVFDQYMEEHHGSSDIAVDRIMDVTAGSSLAKSLTDEIYDLVLLDAPALPDSFAELDELSELMGNRTSFQELQDLIYSIPLNTKARRFLYGSVQGFAKYFPRHTHLPDKDERQLMIDLVDPVLQGAFDVFGMSRDVSEVAIVGSGERRNLEKQPSEKIDRCKRADFVAYDNCGRQLVLAECSTIYETDQRKLSADKWKISRAMKDTYDSTIKKYGEKVRPHSRLSVFGVQTFGQKVTLLQLDFRNIYRLWQLAWVDVPTSQTEFELMFTGYVTKVLRFAKLVEMEVVCRDRQPILSDREVVVVSRARNRLNPTTPSPRNSMTSTSARRLSKPSLSK